MKINQRQKEDIHVIELVGELDFHNSPKLREELLKSIEKQTKKILVNLKKVSYIDSSGLATFVEALQKSKKSNTRLVLAELETRVRSVFEIAKLDEIFLFVSSEEEGVTLLGSK
ncbi:MAG: STAS domain-containing protein [Candidatus Omnitrophica bacterium]|nr:STAS domain-containing protein [Candidatus Omnitrophota bacterium]